MFAHIFSLHFTCPTIPLLDICYQLANLKKHFIRLFSEALKHLFETTVVLQYFPSYSGPSCTSLQETHWGSGHHRYRWPAAAHDSNNTLIFSREVAALALLVSLKPLKYVISFIWWSWGFTLFVHISRHKTFSSFAPLHVISISLRHQQMNFDGKLSPFTMWLNLCYRFTQKTPFIAILLTNF